ncbi:hypothetical protein ANN_05012 [Periplaneta americana]|uniref:Uncharacterized protein n=1 Tax=Periplaneta americana TaxID=6978 RepID=A0ABQ8TBL4_PERAM|nr:hypothetical protein ANN_05012 [Periplaneta americana]
MDAPIPAPAACEVRSVIKFLNAQGTAPIVIYRQLCQVYDPNVMSKQMWEVLDQSSYSPDLAPSVFHLFEPLKKHLGGKRFNADTAVQQTVMTWLQGLDADFFYGGIDALVYRLNKCLYKRGDYIEK